MGLAKKRSTRSRKAASGADATPSVQSHTSPAHLLVEGLVWADEITVQSTEWLLPLWLPRSNVVLLGGPTGVGKSTMLAAVASHVTGGRMLPGAEPVASGRVVYYTTEEVPSSMVCPRLIAAGARMDRVGFAGYTADGRIRHRLQLPTDEALFRQTITTARAQLVILDPITSYLSAGCDQMSGRDVRALIEMLIQTANETGSCIIMTLHDRKSSMGKSIEHFAGSAAWTQTCRQVLRLGHHPKEEGRYLLAPEKTQLGPTPRSHTYDLVCQDGPPQWRLGPESDLSTDDLGSDFTGTDDRDAMADAKAFLLAELKDGEQRTKELQLRAQESAISFATLRRAKTALGIKPHRIPFGGTHYAVWRLPE